jgi:hypothetical protein
VKWIPFWKLIDSGVDDPKVVRRQLEELSEQDLVDFFWRLQERADHLMGEEYAANMEPPHSEDYQEDIAHWVVRQGSRFYQKVAKNPDEFPGELPEDDDDISYLSWAGDVYYDRYGKTIRAPEDPPPPNA